MVEAMTQETLPRASQEITVLDTQIRKDHPPDNHLTIHSEPGLLKLTDFLSQMSDDPHEFMKGASFTYKIMEMYGNYPTVSAQTMREFITDIQTAANKGNSEGKPKDAMDILFGLDRIVEDGKVQIRKRSPQELIEPHITNVPVSTEKFGELIGLLEPQQQLGAQTILTLKEKQKEKNRSRNKNPQPTWLRPNQEVALKTA